MQFSNILFKQRVNEVSIFDKSNDCKLVQLENINSIVLFSIEPLKLFKFNDVNDVQLLNIYEKSFTFDSFKLYNFISSNDVQLLNI